MAIVFENKYHKIIDYKVNFENNSTYVGLRVYGNSLSRDREKLLINPVKNLKEKIQNYITYAYENLMKDIESVQKLNEINDKEEFLKLNPDIKSKLTAFKTIQHEGLYLSNRLLEENIEQSSLEYLNKWKELGLTDEMCKKIDYQGLTTICVEGTKENTLSGLYGEIKKKIVLPCADC